MSGHQHFQKNPSIVMSEQVIMCWVGRSPGCWDGKGVGRQGNDTGGEQQEAWGSLGEF